MARELRPRGAASAPRVALVVDHPARDLAGLVLTARALCRAGVVCHLVPLNLAARELWALAPDFVLLNYARRGNEPLARALADAGVRLGVHDTEGGVWPDCGAYRELLWTDAALRERLACVCMWGPRLARDVVEHGFFAPGQVVVTGCPRFDLYHDAWRGLLANAAAATRRPILVATSFGYGNPRFATAGENARRLREGLGWPAERVERYFAAERAGMEAMIDVARRLSADYPELGVVVRPHPFESPEPYRRALAGLPGLVVDGAGPATERIAGASALVQCNSSIAIEAALAGLPVLSARWVPTPVPVPQADAVSRSCGSYEELRRTLAAALAGDADAAGSGESLRQVVKDWFLCCDGRAHRRVADAVLARLPEQREVDERTCRRRLAGAGPARPLPQRVAGELRFRLGLGADFSFRALRRLPSDAWARTDKAFTAEAVAALLARIDHVEAAGQGRPPRVRAEPARARGDYPAGYAGHAVTLASGAGEGA